MSESSQQPCIFKYDGYKTQSLVFYDKLADEEEKPKDKSGVREVNELCPKVDLYPEHKFKGSFYALPVTHSSDQQTSHPLLIKTATNATFVVMTKAQAAFMQALNIAIAL